MERPTYTFAITIAILLVLGSLAIALAWPRMVPGPSKVPAAAATLRKLEVAISRFRADMGRLPSTEEGLESLVRAPEWDGTKWKGPYLPSTVPVDPWGNAFVYEGDSAGTFTLLSLGADNAPGGVGEAADISP